MADINEYIAKQKQKGLSNEAIIEKLIAHGWSRADAESAIAQDDDDVPPPPVTSDAQHKKTHSGQTEPMAVVVDQLSTRGFEYKLFSISLIVSLVSIIVLVNTLLYGSEGAGAFYAAVLVVTLPIMLVLYTRLQKAESQNKTLKKDPSRRKVIQGIMVVAFLGLLIHSIVFLSFLFNGEYGKEECPPYDRGSLRSYDYERRTGCTYNARSITDDVTSLLVTWILAGGVFVKYWRDEHKQNS